MKTVLDSLIIGHGLAGALLAERLSGRGERVLVVDEEGAPSSSAAGAIVNPIAGRRLTLAPRFAAMHEAALARYRQLGEGLGCNPVRPMPLLKLFDSADQSNRLRERLADADYARWIEDMHAPGDTDLPLADELGGFWLRGAFQVRVRTLLSRLAERRRENGELLEVRLDPATLTVHATGVEWRGYRARRAVFCDGAGCAENPRLAGLRLQFTQGEVLRLKTGAPLPAFVIQRRHWLLPEADGHFRFGATYRRGTLSGTPSARGREELLSALEKLYPGLAPEIVEHRAGVRPITRDNRPVVGRHPEHPALWIFNGLGSKGALFAPFHADRLADHLLRGTELPSGCSPGRFWKP